VTVEFVATEAGAGEGRDFVKAWVSCPAERRHLAFQRSRLRGSGDAMMYVLFDRHPHTTPGRIVSCRLTRTELDVRLSGFLDDRFERFVVALGVTDPEWAEFASAMAQVVGRDEDVVPASQ